LGGVPGGGITPMSLPSEQLPATASTNTFFHLDGNCNGVTSGAQQSACHTGQHFFINANTADKNLCIISGLISHGVLPVDGNPYYIGMGNQRILVSAQLVGNILGNFSVKMCGGSSTPSVNYGYTQGTYSNGVATVNFRRDAANFTGSGQNLLAKITVSGAFGNGGWGNKNITIQYVANHSSNGGGAHYQMSFANGYISTAFANDPSSTGRMAFAVLGNSYSSFALGEGASGGGLSGTLSSPQGWNNAMMTGSNPTYESLAGSISSSISVLNYMSSQRATYGIASSSQTEGWDCQQPSGVPDITAQVQSVMNSISAQCL
ncbi:MAG: hypothetical protein N2578_03085, partial [Bdellovibrionaceae bacterium]|nr:hypothetical protein [Pseudobdellovibrionaceae bacterium]